MAMSLSTVRSRLSDSRLLAGPAIVCAVAMAVALTGCSLVSAAKKVENTVHSNGAVIGLFTTNLKSGQPTSFEVTYVTTGSSPSKIIYAVQPPDQLAFTDTLTGPAAGAGLSNFRLIVNSRGEYVCTLAGSSWSCQKQPKSGATAERTLLDFYTPAHWVSFLKGFSLAAGFAGDKISTSSTTVNGFAMQCVDFVASGIPGTSKICTTSQHLLGDIQVASQSTGFEITSYSSSPAASLFALPTGAKVTTANGG
jgi:hypothetical protein